MKMAIASRKNK